MLLDLIEDRRSVRDYLDKEIPQGDLEKILKAGWLAPSWMNVQSWKFILVRNKESKELLSSLALNQPQVKNAPAVVVCIASKGAWGKEEFSKTLIEGGISPVGVEKLLSKPMLNPSLVGEDKVLLRSVEQVTYAISYMMLEAKELGVDSCVVGAIYNETTIINQELNSKVREVLNLKEDDVLVSMLTLGYSKDEQTDKTPKIRKNFNSVVYFEKLN